MAIDPLSEQVISLAEAARTLPRRRAGKKVHTSCLYRWTVTGCKGVVLESIQIGGTRCTSREALARFFLALTYGSDHRPTVRSVASRRRAIEHAVRALGAEGV